MFFKYLFLPLIFVFFQEVCKAQKKAVTESGNEVILYENGTWKYLKEFDANDSNKIELNSLSFTKSKNASFLLKSTNGNLGYWIDPKKWKFGKSTSNPNADFELEFKGQSLQGVIVSEAANIPIESYVEIALQNGRQSAPDLKIMHKEYRIVNGLKVLHLEMEGTQAGVKFTYYSYYFSNESSTVQFLVVCYATTFKKFKNEAEELLNGLTIIPSSTVSDTSKSNKNIQPNNSNNLTQGLYSPNNKCKQFFVGNWKYSINGKLINVERTFTKTIEFMENRKYLFEYENRWLNECSYEIVFKRTTKPNFKLIKVGEVIKVDILEIDQKSMRYSATFRGVDTVGEMVKEEK